MGEKYGMSGTDMFETFTSVAGATILALKVSNFALKGLGLVTKVLVPPLTGGVFAGGLTTFRDFTVTWGDNVKVAIQNGSFERDIPMCCSRGYLSIKNIPNLSDDEKKVQLTKFSQEYKAKLENDAKPSVWKDLRVQLIKFSQEYKQEKFLQNYIAKLQNDAKPISKDFEPISVEDLRVQSIKYLQEVKTKLSNAILTRRRQSHQFKTTEVLKETFLSIGFAAVI